MLLGLGCGAAVATTAGTGGPPNNSADRQTAPPGATPEAAGRAGRRLRRRPGGHRASRPTNRRASPRTSSIDGPPGPASSIEHGRGELGGKAQDDGQPDGAPPRVGPRRRSALAALSSSSGSGSPARHRHGRLKPAAGSRRRTTGWRSSRWRPPAGRPGRSGRGQRLGAGGAPRGPARFSVSSAASLPRTAAPVTPAVPVGEPGRGVRRTACRPAHRTSRRPPASRSWGESPGRSSRD